MNKLVRSSSRHAAAALALLIGLALAAPAGAEPPPLVQAQKRFSSGDYSEAAALYMTAADQAATTERQGMLIMAAEAAIRADQRDTALEALHKTDPRLLTPDQRVHGDLIRAELGQLADDPADVLRRLPPPGASADRGLASRILGIRSDAYLRLGDTIQAIRTLVQREQVIRDSHDATRNRLRIWQTLTATPKLSSQTAAQADIDAETRGWIELALIDRAAWGDELDRNLAVTRWQDRYPKHPANDDIVDMLRDSTPNLAVKVKVPRPPPAAPPGAATPSAVARSRSDEALPAVAFATPPGASSISLPGPTASGFRTVALILPLTGPLALPAKAVRDGFLTAYYDLPEPKPRLLILDTGPSANNVFNFYEQAVQQGADLIVGPLAKEAVTSLARTTMPNQPVLALNYLESNDTAPANFYQFGLAPEDEARQVAERAYADGRRRAIALVPEGDWGTRTLAAFRERLESLGGVLLDSKTFSTSGQNYANAISRLLKLGPPPAGKPDQPPMYQPAPGNDPDFVFVAAQPAQARQIRPQFRFYGAGFLPMYATSHVYEGSVSAPRDDDLDGVVFCDMPWIIGSGDVALARERMRTLWPDNYTRFPRLYAFGWDAARLLTVLRDPARANGYTAATGTLRVGNDGRIRRSLLWARFENGIPQLLPDAAIHP